MLIDMVYDSTSTRLNSAATVLHNIKKVASNDVNILTSGLIDITKTNVDGVGFKNLNTASSSSFYNTIKPGSTTGTPDNSGWLTTWVTDPTYVNIVNTANFTEDNTTANSGSNKNTSDIGTINKIIFYSGTKYLAVTTTGIWSFESTDSKIWTSVQSGNFINICTNGTYILAANSSNVIYSSTNGLAFTVLATDLVASATAVSIGGQTTGVISVIDSVYRMEYVGTTSYIFWLGRNSSSTIYYNICSVTTDGITFTNHTSISGNTALTTTNTYTSFAYTETTTSYMYYVFWNNATGYFFSSSNGTTWTSKTPVVTMTSTGYVTLCGNNTQFQNSNNFIWIVNGASSPTIYYTTSTTGTPGSWTTKTTNPLSNIQIFNPNINNSIYYNGSVYTMLIIGGYLTVSDLLTSASLFTVNYYTFTPQLGGIFSAGGDGVTSSKTVKTSSGSVEGNVKNVFFTAANSSTLVGIGGDAKSYSLWLGEVNRNKFLLTNPNTVYSTNSSSLKYCTLEILNPSNSITYLYLKVYANFVASSNTATYQCYGGGTPQNFAQQIDILTGSKLSINISPNQLLIQSYLIGTATYGCVTGNGWVGCIEMERKDPFSVNPQTAYNYPAHGFYCSSMPVVNTTAYSNISGTTIFLPIIRSSITTTVIGSTAELYINNSVYLGKYARDFNGGQVQQAIECFASSNYYNFINSAFTEQVVGGKMLEIYRGYDSTHVQNDIETDETTTTITYRVVSTGTTARHLWLRLSNSFTQAFRSWFLA